MMQKVSRKRRTMLFGAFILVMLIISSISIVTMASHPVHAAGGSGATLPYAEMEAHSQPTNGTILGPSLYGRRSRF